MNEALKEFITFFVIAYLIISIILLIYDVKHAPLIDENDDKFTD